MSLVDACTIFGAVVSLVCLPTAIISLRQLYKVWRPYSEDLLSSVMSRSFTAQQNENCVLLQFDPSRASKEGTFEHNVLKFRDALPLKNLGIYNFRDILLWDPNSVIKLAEPQIKMTCIFSSEAAYAYW
jgi:hypothetical protein